MQHPAEEHRETSRRTVMSAAALAATAAGLTACGGSGGGSGGGASPSAAGQAGGAALAKTSDIPAGGGKVFPAQKVVVTQPTPQQFHAFSATCTHMGCTVSTVANGTINCPCHGSKYSITDASVVSGPAPRPLPKMNIQVANGEIRLQ